MLNILLASLALAAEPLPSEQGTLAIDARLPVEVLVDGENIAQTYRATRIEVDMPAGKHALRVYTNGNPSDLEIVVPAAGRLAVLAGRTGLSVDHGSTPSAPREVAAHDVSVQVRMADTIGARLMVGSQRFQVSPGQQLEIELPTGEHRLSVRSEDGTVIWATGNLTVDGPDPVVVQLSEGRLPEVSGRGAFSSRK